MLQYPVRQHLTIRAMAVSSFSIWEKIMFKLFSFFHYGRQSRTTHNVLKICWSTERERSVLNGVALPIFLRRKKAEAGFFPAVVHLYTVIMTECP